MENFKVGDRVRLKPPWERKSDAIYPLSLNRPLIISMISKHIVYFENLDDAYWAYMQDLEKVCKLNRRNK